jgi:hypothetical protein
VRKDRLFHLRSPSGLSDEERREHSADKKQWANDPDATMLHGLPQESGWTIGMPASNAGFYR